MNNQEKYRSLTILHRELPLFFQPWWLDAACRSWDIAIQGPPGAPTALFPYQIEKKWGLTLLRSPLLTPYLGPCFRQEKDTLQAQWDFEEEALEELWKQLPRWDFLQFETAPGYTNLLPMQHKGLSNSSKLTYHLDITQTEEQLFKGIHSRRRSYIRQAEKITRIEISGQPDLELFTQWHRQAFERKKKYYPFSASFFERMIAAANHAGASLFLTARNQEGTPLAMLWTPFDQKTAYHLLGAFDPKQQLRGVMDLLVWTAIKAAKQRGQQVYDFEGSMDKGIEAFFRKFGGIRKTYLHFQQHKSLIWKIKSLILD